MMVHGASPRIGPSPEYQVWKHMRERCHNPRHLRFAHYGGRGIAITPRWDSFATFLADMGPRPFGFTLDRINVDGPYAPENCRWADASTQARNKRQTGHCGGRDGAPRCGYFAGHGGYCQTPPFDWAESA